MATRTPDYDSAVVKDLLNVRERAVRKLYDRGLSADEIAGIFETHPGRIRLLLDDPLVSQERSDAWSAILARFFHRISDEEMMRRLLAITFHTYARPSGPWYESPPTSSLTAISGALHDGYLSDEEYRRVVRDATKVSVPGPQLTT